MLNFAVEKLWNAGKWYDDQIVTVDEDQIQKVLDREDFSGSISANLPYAFPGLIDVHTHGAVWQSANEPDIDSFYRWCVTLAERGVCAFVPTVYTDRIENMRKAVQVISELMVQQSKGLVPGARILGIHLEGPCLAATPPGLGTMNPDYLQAARPEVFDAIVGEHWVNIRIVTMAPELDGVEETAEYLEAKGVLLHAGHSNADYDLAKVVFTHHFDGVCHFFNAAKPLHHRDLSWLLAAIEEPRMKLELIADGLHVLPPMRRLLERLVDPDRLLYVTDALFPAGLADGRYTTDSEEFWLKDGLCRLADGSLYGGSCFLSDFIAAQARDDAAFEYAIKASSLNVARHLRNDCLGELVPGRKALITVFDHDRRCLGAIIGEEKFGNF